MGTSIMAVVAAVGQAISSVFNWALGRSALKNTQAMQAAQAAADEQKAKDRTNEAIKNEDTEEIRKELAE